MTKKGNIEFYPHKRKIKYNAIRRFGANTIKIPDYIVNEVFKNKMHIDVYHKGKFQKSYNFDNLHGYIQGQEHTSYTGRFRNKDIEYKLINLEVPYTD